MTKLSRALTSRWIPASVLLTWLGLGCPDAQPLTTEDLQLVTHHSIAPFESEDDFDDYLDEVRGVRAKAYGGWTGFFGCSAGDSALSAPGAEAKGQDESITNNQEAGVDEGDIVKVAGDHLVILRRGRLFSVRIADAGQDTLAPVGWIDTRAPGFTQSSWYDEMLIRNERIVVIGYSYEIGATEIGLFTIDPRGQLSHEATHFITSNDYYSSRNYASRLVGDTLVLYMPYMLFSSMHAGDRGDDAAVPAIRSWLEQDELTDWEPVVAKTSVYRPVQPTPDPTLHTVLRCDLNNGFVCEGTAVIGPWSRSFYVSRDAVYVWVAPWTNRRSTYDEQGNAQEQQPAVPESHLYRIPLGEPGQQGGAVGALRARGGPIDQFSFLESEGHINVLLTEDPRGDGFWHPERSGGALSLLRVPLTLFSSTPTVAQDRAYRTLPAPYGRSLQNRFAGDHLLYAAGTPWGYGAEGDRRLFVTRYDGNHPVFEVDLELHDAERIEVMGRGALVVGSSGGDLHLSAIGVDGVPRVTSRFTKRGAAQGETRSHGFFFKPRGDSGLLGLPVRSSGNGYHQLYYGSAEVQFLESDPLLRLEPIGVLSANAQRQQVDDHCEVSCVDWYGNARPIFLRDRIFALLGYELVEGQLTDGTMRELRRVDFTPQ